MLSWSKPLMIVLGLIGGGFGGVWLVNNYYIETTADGKPMDWAGDGLKCPHCSGVLVWQSGHKYQCEGCKQKMTGRADANYRIIFVDLK